MKRVECFEIELNNCKTLEGKHFVLEIILTEKVNELWLKHPMYGIKTFVYGTLPDDIVMSWANINLAIEDYIERFTDLCFDKIEGEIIND